MESTIIANEIKKHAYITCVLNIVRLNKQEDTIQLFMLVLTVTLLPENIQSNFTLRLLFKKVQIEIAPWNYTSQLKLNYR